MSITPCIWFDSDGEDAAKLYTSLFPNSKIINVTHYGPDTPRPEGTVLTVEFELDGQVHRAQRRPASSRSTRRSRSRSAARTRTRSTATGTGSSRAAASMARAAGSRTASASRGRSSRPRCRGCSATRTGSKANRVMQAMLKMGKLEIAELERAAEGVPV